MSSAEEVFSQRIYIDPERLIRLKKQRTFFQMVPSVFEPPQDQHSHQEDVGFDQTQQLMNKANTKSIFQEQLPYDLSKKNRIKNSKIEYIKSLIPNESKKDIQKYEEGDCINMNFNDKWLVLEGEIKVTSNNHHSYHMGEGYLFFIAAETKQKVKEIICLTPTKLLRITQDIYKDYLKNYIFLKNAQKIKYLKYCPFFMWNDQLSEDLALSMQNLIYEKEQIIYKANDAPGDIYFVKEGIVLLERNSALNNHVIRDYEAHYEKSQVSDNQITLIVKKGMVFGVDGLLLKEIEATPDHLSIHIYNPSIHLNHSEKLEHNNPQNMTVSPSIQPQIFKSYELRNKLNQRVYTAKTIGKTELYCLRKEVLESLFNLDDILNINNAHKQISVKELERICVEYTDMIVKHKSISKISRSLKKRDMVLDNVVQNRTNNAQELFEKKNNVKKMREDEEKVKKKSIASIISDRKNRVEDQNNKKQHYSHRKKSLEEETISFVNKHIHSKLILQKSRVQQTPFSFPLLSKRSSSQHLNKKQKVKQNREMEDRLEKQLFTLIKSHKEQIAANIQLQQIKISREYQRAPIMPEKMNLINIKSYRSIISL